MKLINNLVMGAIGAIFTYACLVGIYEAANWVARHYPFFAYIKPIVTALILMQFAVWTTQNGNHLLRRDDKRFDPENLRGSAIYCAASLYLFLLSTQKLQSLLIGSDTASLWQWNSVAYEISRLPLPGVILLLILFMLAANGALAGISSYILVARNASWSLPGIWQDVDTTAPDFDPEGKATHDIRQHIKSLRAEIDRLHQKLTDLEKAGKSTNFKYETLIKTEAALRQDHFRALTEIERLGQIRKTQDADLKDARDNLASANQECAQLRAEIEELKHTTIGKATHSAATNPDDAIQTLMALDPANTPKQIP
jgi:hypothetical protein